MAQAFLILVYLFIYFLEVLEFCTVWGNGNDDYQKFIFKDSFKRTNRKLDAFFAVFFRLFTFAPLKFQMLVSVMGKRVCPRLSTYAFVAFRLIKSLFSLRSLTTNH